MAHPMRSLLTRGGIVFGFGAASLVAMTRWFFPGASGSSTGGAIVRCFPWLWGCWSAGIPRAGVPGWPRFRR